MTNKKEKNTKGVSKRKPRVDMSTKIKKKAALAAFEKSLGNTSATCKTAEISRETFYRWCREDAEFKERVEEIQEANVDFAETSLLKNIREGKETSIIFFLKTKGKDRGYVERQELTGANGKAMQVESKVNINNLTDDEIVLMAKLDSKLTKE